MKSSKTEVRYRNWPNRNESCQDCTMFREPDDCTAVNAGKDGIDPFGWCTLFERKGEK